MKHLSITTYHRLTSITPVAASSSSLDADWSEPMVREQKDMLELVKMDLSRGRDFPNPTVLQG